MKQLNIEKLHKHRLERFDVKHLQCFDVARCNQQQLLLHHPEESEVQGLKADGREIVLFVAMVVVEADTFN